MKRNMTLGALLVGIGVGLLINAWFPLLRAFWPLGLIAGGVLLWREMGPYSARVGLIAASLAIPLFGGFAWGGFNFEGGFGGGRELARFESSDDDKTSWENVERLLIVNTEGDITVEADDEIDVDVVYRSNRRNAPVPEGLQTDYDETSQTLRVIGVDPKLPQNERRNLSADIKVSVPDHVRVEIVNDRGDVSVTEVASAQLETNIGDIHASEIAGTTSAHSDVGDIRLDNVSGEIDAKTNTGDITVDLSEPLEATLTAQSDVGDITLELPDDSNVTITATSDTRDLSGDLEKVTGTEGRLRLGSGEFKVELTTNVGGVNVKER
jgi:Putative adhesin